MTHLESCGGESLQGRDEPTLPGRLVCLPTAAPHHNLPETLFIVDCGMDILILLVSCSSVSHYQSLPRQGSHH